MRSMAAELCTIEMPLLNALLFTVRNQEMKADLQVAWWEGAGPESLGIFPLHETSVG